MQCPRCQQENPTSHKFCRECGTPLARPIQGGPPPTSYADLQREVEHLTYALNESLEQQTATSEILRVISSSPTDVQPVLEAVAESAARLCEAPDVSIFVQEADHLRVAARHGPIPSDTALPLSRESGVGWAVLTGRTVHVADMQTELDRFPISVQNARRLGFRTALNVPLIRAGVAIGAISLRRAEAHLFAERQVALLETFADQAVIAIENVRLFKELEARNAELTESLAQQTATSEVLRVISHSPTNIQPVLDAVAESAARLCEAQDAGIFRRDGDRLLFVAHHGPIPFGPVGEFSVPLVRGTANGRSVLDAQTIHVANLQTEVHEYPEGSEGARRFGHRTFLIVPLMREGVAIGSISLRRIEAQLFTDRQVALLKTFADQAVIAIENVRLFTELEARNKDLSETLEQQTATSEILRVISSSPTELQPVLEVVVKSAVRFCGADDAIILRLDGEHLRAAAHHGPIPVDFGLPVPCVRGTVGGRSVLDRRAIHVTDLQAEAGEFPEGSAFATRLGARTTLGVPLLREGASVGTIQLRRAEVNPFTDKQIALLQTFADQAVIAIENVRLFTELQVRNRDLTQALEQQTATAEVLRVIGSSPTDAQPVFEAIVSSARRLLSGFGGAVYRLVGDEIHLAAYVSTNPSGDAALRNSFPRPLANFSPPGEAILRRAPVILTDIETDGWIPDDIRDLIRKRGDRSGVWVPMLREGLALGAIGITRSEPGSFEDEQIALLRTFADQAVIAIENVRLFKELEARNRDLTEALEQQTATSEILGVISSSPADVQPTFEAIARSARRLCDAVHGMVFRFDGALIHLTAHDNLEPEQLEALRSVFPIRPGHESVTARAILTRSLVHVRNRMEEPELEYGILSANFPTTLSVPLLRDGVPLGAITVTRAEVRLFSDKQVELLQTFADQAVIAIENVRLFTEVQARNHELIESLEQQTATSEVLQVISRSPSDVDPTFEVIAASAARLCEAVEGTVFRFDGTLIHIAAHCGGVPEQTAALRQIFPIPPGRGSVTARAILTRAVVHVPDLAADPEHEYGPLVTQGFHTVLSVPMLRNADPIGAITVRRQNVRPFSDSQIDLLKTFADQAVIAVENVRLFKELQARTGELTQSVEKLTALGEVSQVLSSTLDLDTVLTTIVNRAVHLSGADGGQIFEYDEVAEEFQPRASNEVEEVVAATQHTRLRKGEGAVGRMAVTREAIQIPDIALEGAYESRARGAFLRSGRHALLAVPLLSEEHIVGGLVISRNAAGAFPVEVVELLKTFATQSALAIQNARLFREIADKSRQLEAASRHKSEFLANMSHELRTPLNAVIGFSEVLLQRMFGELNAKQDEYLKDIYASGQHLLSLINDILDLSKIEAGRMELAPAPFHLPTALENAVTLVKERAGRHGIVLQVDIDPQLGELVGDERKVKQVLLNLLSNAVKFTPEGGQISLKAGRRNGEVEIAVSDTGIGIAPEDQAAIFEEFRQVGSDETRKQEGTGLGLTLAKKFVELHGGRIWVESEPGRGSTFTFRLPVRP